MLYRATERVRENFFSFWFASFTFEVGLAQAFAKEAKRIVRRSRLEGWDFRFRIDGNELCDDK